ncbi:MAG: hypothetical protein EOM45_14500 [Clostridia bacterium]|nr:hypothetical protein [Clostridia bacterium]
MKLNINTQYADFFAVLLSRTPDLSGDELKEMRLRLDMISSEILKESALWKRRIRGCMRTSSAQRALA